MNTFFFVSVCPLSSNIDVWQSDLNHNRLPERYLPVFCHGMTSSFKTLLKKDNSVPTHYRNIQALATETFLVCKGISQKLKVKLWNIIKDTTLISQKDELKRFIMYDTESLGYLITKKKRRKTQNLLKLSNPEELLSYCKSTVIKCIKYKNRKNFLLPESKVKLLFSC